MVCKTDWFFIKKTTRQPWKLKNVCYNLRVLKNTKCRKISNAMETELANIKNCLFNGSAHRVPPPGWTRAGKWLKLLISNGRNYEASIQDIYKTNKRTEKNPSIKKTPVLTSCKDCFVVEVKEHKGGYSSRQLKHKPLANEDNPNLCK